MTGRFLRSAARHARMDGDDLAGCYRTGCGKQLEDTSHTWGTGRASFSENHNPATDGAPWWRHRSSAFRPWFCYFRSVHQKETKTLVGPDRRSASAQAIFGEFIVTEDEIPGLRHHAAAWEKLQRAETARQGL